MSTGAFSGKVRRLYWTCRYVDCGRSFNTYTRRGLRVTCPHCHRVQEGPEGVRRLLEKVQKKSEAKPATTLKIVAVLNGPQTKPAPALKRPIPKATPKPAPPPPTPAPPKRERDFIARAMGFE